MAERILYYDCTAGISGDMHLGAMIDLGVPLAYLDGELRKLGVAGWTLRTTRDARRGISGTRADVVLDSDADHDHAHHSHDHGHAHSHTHEPHSHAHAHSHSHSHESDHHEHGHAHPHAHRPHREIVALIERSGLSSGAKQRARAIFARLAEAEAKIHGMRVEDVLFHEVGAVDSIVDIVGAAIALDWLKPDRVLASPVELGGGFVRCAHGRLPVPAPATAEILRGVPTHAGAVAFEACTPTGAAILAATVNEFTTETSLVIERIGYGIGHKDGPIANVLRVFLATGAASATAKPAAAAVPITTDREAAVVLECNLDDMTGEAAGHVLERLLAAGASDAWTTPIVMKKSRPAFTLSVLCPPEREAALAQLLLRETTTLGLRRRDVTKLVLPRTVEQVATPLGLVRVKTGWLDGRPVKRKPEHEDLQRLAAERGLPLREVEQIVFSEIARQAPPAPSSPAP